MGLGPSIKMTSLHHFNCPINNLLMKDEDIDFAGIIVSGVSEVCDDKIYSAVRTGYLAQGLGMDAAIVAIDAWGNHHIDFVNIIEQLGIKGIASVGLSYIGLQGRLVCSNEYVDTLIDFNKSESGYESCVVGQNNLTHYDAYKAVALIKSKLKKSKKSRVYIDAAEDEVISKLIHKKIKISEVVWGDRTSIERGVLTLNKELGKGVYKDKYIKDINVSIIAPGEYDAFVNSNLDFAPIAYKARGGIGEGVSHVLDGVSLMLTGVEDISGFQPSNIGSSEGILKEQVVFDREGTPKSTDYIIHIDFLLAEGAGRSNEGIQSAHYTADLIVNEIRKVMENTDEMRYESIEYKNIKRQAKPRVGLIKIVSGLGNMYDTSLFPSHPAGYIGSRQMMAIKNMPIYITGTQCLDGAIHSLL